MPKPTLVKPLSGHRLLLRYSDGVEGELDLSNLAGKGVFALWNQEQAFESVTLGGHGELRWSDDVELCSDALYLELTGKSPEELFPNLKAAADA